MKLAPLLAAGTLLVLTAPMAAAASTDATLDLVEPIANYKLYVAENTAKLVEDTGKFVEAIKAGDVDKAKALYAPTRMSYETVEPIAELFSDLDVSIDARADDYEKGEKDPTFTGFHRIEYGLWEEGSTEGLGDYADKLLADVKDLDQRIADLTFPPETVVGGAAALMEEVAATKISGEEDRYSHTDLWDFKANFDGARKIFELVKPLLTDEAFVSKVSDNFQTVDETLAKYKTGERLRDLRQAHRRRPHGAGRRGQYAGRGPFDHARPARSRLIPHCPTRNRGFGRAPVPGTAPEPFVFAKPRGGAASSLLRDTSPSHSGTNCAARDLNRLIPIPEFGSFGHESTQVSGRRDGRRGRRHPGGRRDRPHRAGPARHAQRRRAGSGDREGREPEPRPAAADRDRLQGRPPDLPAAGHLHDFRPPPAATRAPVRRRRRDQAGVRRRRQHDHRLARRTGTALRPHHRRRRAADGRLCRRTCPSRRMQRRLDRGLRHHRQRRQRTGARPLGRAHQRARRSPVRQPPASAPSN